MGNICRSPLLEGWARQVLTEAGHPAAKRLDSAGTGDWHAGQPPDPRAIAVAARFGVDISGQRARAVVPADFERFDLILCADRRNLTWLRQTGGKAAHERIALALDWCGVAGGGDLPDPYYGSSADFDHVSHLAREVAHGLLRRLPRQA
jgi:protein-tyrosine phosphatase